jgi:hypothetical protein
MHRRYGLRALPIGIIVLMLLVVLGSTSCAPPYGLQPGDSTTQSDQHPVPFHNNDATSSSEAVGSSVHDNSNAAKPEVNIPFHNAQESDYQNQALQNLPAGTLLTVRLKSPIASGNPDAAANFDAVVDQAVVVEGNKLVPSGTIVSGLVESARASNLKLDHGYLRLTLASIHLAGLDVPVETSSLFVRANAAQTQSSQIQVPKGEASSRIIRLESGRRLVFRLTKPVYVTASQRLPSDF